MPHAVTWLPPLDPGADPGEKLLGAAHPHNPLVHRMLDGDESAAVELAARYDDMADIWVEWTAQHAHHYVSTLREGLRHVRADGDVLELAAGTGAGTRVLAERSHRLVAVEPVAAMIGEIDHEQATLVQASGFALPFAAAAFDLVVGLNAVMSAREAQRVLRDDGTVLWCYSFAEDTPVYVPPEVLGEVLGLEVVAQRVGPGMWVALSRTAVGAS